MNTHQDDEQLGRLSADSPGRPSVLRGLAMVGLTGVMGRFAPGAASRRRKHKKKHKPSPPSPPPQASPPPFSPPPPPVPPPPPAPLCDRCPKLCETPHVVLCKPRTDTERCACAWTAAGRPVCVNTVTLAEDAAGTCRATDQCASDADCASGQACVLVDETHCCQAGTAGNLCLPVCTP